MAKKAAPPAPRRAAASKTAVPAMGIAEPTVSAPSPAQQKESELATQRADKERLKARGQTASQKEIDQYNRGDFQTTDPVTGKARKRTGGNWQEEPEPEEDDEDEE